ncbi:glycosyltransferase family 2 protein [Myceligenerans pegani]|uniref:Glycosyltransferase family 2 protein n=1 Tax=Myceligenerans pegani TaxID=2776917 RepID=A0ABR9MYB5_9MICO|nr:glycosyltransferase family 2 protein [Myceligenerans sp. TRM 65318]MBE1876364.1 glycosyltransferase family 2 protein [Myceligenerans sp. TRM 65318]MBE3018635.1 glycosyltransferase family 2 protein [Myceligenerans sp. TRM 65318]
MSDASGVSGTVPEPPGTTPAEPGKLPGVSVFLTVRNEERDLAEAVGRILEQDYAGPFEVVLAVGPSTDRTAEIAEKLSAEEPRLTVVENPAGWTPAGLNAAIRAARHDLLVRVDGHSHIASDYVSRVVRVLLSSGAANVGGIMVPEGRTAFEKAVAVAMSSPLGIGSAPFHTGGRAGPADSVYLGAFRRDALEAVGLYDEAYLRAQDWELNYRLRQAGHAVWFDPALRVGYRPRGSWRQLATQFFRSGRWRNHVMRQYPDTASLRYLAPPAAVCGIAAGVAAGVVGALTVPWLLWGLVIPGGYVLGVTAGSLREGRELPPRSRALLPGVLAVMHMSWGAGFLRGPERHS